MRDINRRDFMKWSALGGAVGPASLVHPLHGRSPGGATTVRKAKQIRLTAAVTDVDLGKVT